MKSIRSIVHLSGILLALCALALPAPAQTFTTTAVQGTVYAAGGKPVSGTLQLTWPAFTTAAGQAVAAGRTTVTIGSDGFFSVNLAPNIGAMPAGLYYTAIYHLGDGTTSTEYWVIPAAAQATLSQVRATVMPAAQAVQAVSKAYVDQTINEAVQGQMTVFGGSLTGPLYLAGDPNQPTEAADKHYVDGQFSGALPIGGGVLSGPVTGPQIGAVWQVDQFKAADFGASLQLCIGNLNPNYGGTCDARNFTGALSMAANLTLSVPNATVYLPCSTISTAASIVVPAGVRNVTLHGCATQGTSASSGSQGGTVILYSGSAAAIQVGDQTYAVDTMGFHLDNVVVNTTAATGSTAQALSIRRTQEVSLSGIYLLGNANQTGITLDGTGNYTGGTVQDVHISGFETAINGIGHQTQNPAATDWLNASTFVRLHIDCPTTNGIPQAGTTGINLQAGDGNTFTGGDVEGCGTALHLGANAQNNTLVGLRNENSTSQVVADAGSAYNNWITGGTMYTGRLTDNGTRNSFLDTFHRSFNSLNGDWYGSQQDATVTNHFRLGTGAGNERGLYNRYQTDLGYRWTTGLSDAVAGEQYYQILDELNNVYRLSIGQYNNGQGGTNNQTAINAAGTGAVVLNGSNNAGTGGVAIGSGGPSSATVATIDKSGNAHFTGTLLTDGTSQSAGTMTVRNNADAEVDYYLWPGLTASQKGSLTYKDFNGNSQWYLVKDQNNNWALNSATGGLDSFKAYQSTNSGDTYINASNGAGVVRINYETGSGTAFNIYGGGSSNLYASFTGPSAIKFPGLAATSGVGCVQADTSGWFTNSNTPCSTASMVGSTGLRFSDASVQTTSQQGALTGLANDATARTSASAAQTAASAAQTTANTAQATAAAALPANGATSTGSGSANVVAFPGAVAAGAAINGYQYVTSGNSLSAANLALVAAGGGSVYLNTTPVTLSTVQQIGSTSGVPVTLELGSLTTPITLATGGELELCNGSQLRGSSSFGAGGTTAGVYVGASAAMADVIAPCKADNTQEAMGVSDIFVLSNSSSTPISITGTVVSGNTTVTGVSSFTGITVGNLVTGIAFARGTQVAGIDVPNDKITLTQGAIVTASATTIQIQGAQFHAAGIYSGTVLRNIGGNLVHTGPGLLIDGGVFAGGVPGLSTDVEVDGYRFWGSSANASNLPVVAVWAIPGSTGSNGITNLTMLHGDAEKCSAGHPLMDINGFSGSTGSGSINGFFGSTLDLEAKNSTAICNGLHIMDAHRVEELNVTSEAPGTQSGAVADDYAAAAVVINESYPGSTTQVHVSGYNEDWPTTILDWVGANDFSPLAANLSAGCSAVTVTGIPANTVAPLAGQPIEIMDGQLTEVIYAAYGTGSGTTFSVASPGCKYAHSYTSYPQPTVVWNPKWVQGPGPAGLYAGRVTLAVGGLSMDANGVVTVTVPGDNYVFEDRHIGEYVTLTTSGTDIATFGNGMVQITGLGAYCTNSSAQQYTCPPGAFQYHGTTTGPTTSANLATLWVDTVSTYDYTEPGDSTYVSYGPGNRIPELRGSVNVRDGANPTALTVSGFDSDNHGYYSSLFFGSGAKLPYANSTTQNDLFSEAECNTNAGFAVNCGALHVRTGPGDQNNLYLGAHGTDDYYVGYSDGLLHRTGTGSPAVPDLGHSFTWTGQQTFSATTYFGAVAQWAATGTATSGANYASSSSSFLASVWNGSAAVNDSVSATWVPTTGSNPRTTMLVSRSTTSTGSADWTFSKFDRIGVTNVVNGQTPYLNFANVNHTVNYYLPDSAANTYLLAGPNAKGLTEGVATLSSGTATVTTTAACTPGTSCVYTLTDCGASGTTLGSRFGVGTVSAGTSFVIDAWSTSKAVVTTDSSSVCWAIH